MVLFRPSLLLLLCVLCLRLFTVRLSCTFLYWGYLFHPLLDSSYLASSLLAVGIGPVSDVGWCVLSALCFLQPGVAILLLLFPLVLHNFVSLFVGLLGLLRLRCLLLRCIFLHDHGLLLFQFLCSGSAGLYYHSFRIPRSCSFISSFPTLFLGPLLQLPLIPSGFLLLLCVLWLPFFPLGSFWAFWHILLSFGLHPSQVSSFLRFVTRAAVSLSLSISLSLSLSQFPHLSNLLAVLRCFWFSSSATFFPLRVPSLFLCGFCLDRISGSLRDVVSLRVEPGFALPYVPLSSRNSFWCSFFLSVWLVIFL